MVRRLTALGQMRPRDRRAPACPLPAPSRAAPRSLGAWPCSCAGTAGGRCWRFPRRRRSPRVRAGARVHALDTGRISRATRQSWRMRWRDSDTLGRRDADASHSSCMAKPGGSNQAAHGDPSALKRDRTQFPMQRRRSAFSPITSAGPRKPLLQHPSERDRVPQLTITPRATRQ